MIALAQIESPEGLANVEAIVATPGIDGLFPGMVDYALMAHGALLPRMSFLGDLVREPLVRIIEVTHAAGKSIGLPSSIGEIGQVLELGADWVHCGGDTSWLLSGAGATVSAWRNVVE